MVFRSLDASGPRVRVDLAEYRKLFEEATVKPLPSHQHYFAMVERLLPIWGGSYVLIDEFVAQSVAKTLAAEGTTLYARLYWYVDQRGSRSYDLFKESKVRWPSLRRASRNLLAGLRIATGT